MKKCLKITFTLKRSDTFLYEFIQRHARDLEIEGNIQFLSPDQCTIVACGTKENIDTFLDFVHEGIGSHVPENVYVEPFLKDKDYRGTFRVLE